MEQKLMPHARHTDPQTSHEAAASVNLNSMTATKKMIYAILQEPFTDEQIAELYENAVRLGLAPRASLSGIRSRRNELYREHLIEPIGYGKTVSNRRAIIWQASARVSN
jgi:hypothetical protein